MSKLLNDSFIIVKLDVLEQGPKKALENPGGVDLMKQWDGEKAGLPYIVILDANGKKLADGNEMGKDGHNIGYPAAPNEIAHFMKMLKAGSKLNESQRSAIQAWLVDHAPKG